MKSDPALDTVRKVRAEISREFGNDPARLVAHYVEMQATSVNEKMIYGPEDPKMSTPRPTKTPSA